VETTLYQEWKGQNVFMLDVAGQVTKEFIVCIRANIAKNQFPDANMNKRFQTIIKDRFKIGAGYVITKISSVDASFAYVPK
jgi:hypothetical protein